MVLGRISVRGAAFVSSAKEKGNPQWLLARRNGLARSTFYRFEVGDRFSGRSVLNEAQFRLDATLSRGGFSACPIPRTCTRGRMAIAIWTSLR